MNIIFFSRNIFSDQISWIVSSQNSQDTLFIKGVLDKNELNIVLKFEKGSFRFQNRKYFVVKQSEISGNISFPNDSFDGFGQKSGIKEVVCIDSYVQFLVNHRMSFLPASQFATMQDKIFMGTEEEQKYKNLKEKINKTGFYGEYFKELHKLPFCYFFGIVNSMNQQYNFKALLKAYVLDNKNKIHNLIEFQKDLNKKFDLIWEGELTHTKYIKRMNQFKFVDICKEE